MSAQTPDPTPPRGNDFAKLCTGEQVTSCCGAYATFHDETLCCKVCWREVGQGDDPAVNP